MITDETRQSRAVDHITLIASQTHVRAHQHNRYVVEQLQYCSPAASSNDADGVFASRFGISTRHCRVRFCGINDRGLGLYLGVLHNLRSDYLLLIQYPIRTPTMMYFISR